MKTFSRWTTVAVLGAVAGTGAYYRQWTDNSGSVPSQTVVHSEVDLTHTKEGTPEIVPQPVVHPAANAVIRTVPESANAASSPPTPEQQRTFERLRNRLHAKRSAHPDGYREFLASSVPEWESLPEGMQGQIMAELMALAERDETGLQPSLAANTIPEPMALTAAEATASPPPTAAQLQTYERLRSKLYDPEFTQTRTFDQIASMAAQESLPLVLQQQFVREVLEMLKRGELHILSPAESQEISNP